jgi:hypothetical protein
MGSLSGGTAGVLAAQLAAFVAVLLAVSAGHKVVKWSYSRNVVREFAGLPHHVATAALAAAALGEAVAGVLLLLPGAHLRMIGASLAAAIWAAYLVFILRAVLQGRREVDCGCSFGSGAGANHRPLGAFQIGRNAVLLGLAILVAASARGAVPVQGSQLLAACALLALYGALDQVMALAPMRSGEVS